MQMHRPKQPVWMSHAEAISNLVAGIVIAAVVNTLYGIPWKTTLDLIVVLTIASYVRSYTIRRIFTRFG